MTSSDSQSTERLACGYGVHDFRFVESNDTSTHVHECTRCGAVYSMLNIVCNCRLEGVRSRAKNIVSEHKVEYWMAHDPADWMYEHNVWFAKCSCEKWTQHALYKSRVTELWNLHLYMYLLKADITLHDLLDVENGENKNDTQN